MRINQVMGATLAILLAMCISFIVGQRVGIGMSRKNVIIREYGACHSITEDSAPYDCKFTRIDSKRGEWYK